MNPFISNGTNFGGVVDSPHISSFCTTSWLMKEKPTKKHHFYDFMSSFIPRKTTYMWQQHPIPGVIPQPFYLTDPCTNRTTGTVTEVLALVPIPERLLEHKVLLELPHPRHSAKLPQNEWPLKFRNFRAHRETRRNFIVIGGRFNGRWVDSNTREYLKTFFYSNSVAP